MATTPEAHPAGAPAVGEFGPDARLCSAWRAWARRRGPPYVAIALLTFADMAAFEAAAAQHGKEIFADIAKLTSIRPVMQFNDAVS